MAESHEQGKPVLFESEGDAMAYAVYQQQRSDRFPDSTLRFGIMLVSVADFDPDQDSDDGLRASCRVKFVEEADRIVRRRVAPDPYVYIPGRS
jgi:hypothetical protein